MPAVPDQHATTGGGAERLSLIRRLIGLPVRAVTAARRRPLLTTVLCCGTGIILVCVVSVIHHYLTHLPTSDRHVTIEAALRLLDEGKHEQAKEMAQRLRHKVGNDYRRLGQPLFVQGAVLAQEASLLGQGEERRTIYLVAARYLEEARNHGFPPGRAEEGRYLLGNCLYQAEQYAESLRPLLEAYERNPGEKYILARLLSTAYLRDTVPNRREAARFTRIWLEDPALSREDRELATLQLAEIHLEDTDLAACRRALAEIRPDSRYRGQALLLEGRLAMREGDQLIASLLDSGLDDTHAKDKYREAIGLLGDAQAHDDPQGILMRQSKYLIGVCHLKVGDTRAALTAFERAEKGHFGTPEAFAAMLTRAEVLLQQGRTEAALEVLLRVVKEAGDPDLYQNSWVPLSELQGRLSIAHKQFVSGGEFEAALALLRADAGLSPADLITVALAETYEAWGHQEVKEAAELAPGPMWRRLSAARRHFRMAGTEYRKLAELRFATPHYPDDLWKSGECFRLGQNYSTALQLLHTHLQCVPRSQSAPGLTSLGECYLSLAQYHAAIRTLEECISLFPKHPESYRARLLASVAYLEKREAAEQAADAEGAASRREANLEKARALLLDNLHNSSLTPRSRYWRQSKLAYGKLLYQEAHQQEQAACAKQKAMDSAATPVEDRTAGMEQLKASHDLFQKAIEHLDEMVQREEMDAATDGRVPDSSEARYYVAEAFRHSANFKRRAWEIEPTQTRRISLRQEMRGYLQHATGQYRQLQELLARKQNYTELSPVEKRILRNTYFAYADTLYELEDYDAAITAYVEATNRYQQEPEALEALMRCASCYRQLQQPDEARGTLAQAAAVLSRIPATADFAKTTRYDRKQWEQLIAWLTTL